MLWLLLLFFFGGGGREEGGGLEEATLVEGCQGFFVSKHFAKFLSSLLIAIRVNLRTLKND